MSLRHVLLGVLKQPATGYDIKKAFDTELRHFWHAELSQIYPVLKRLEADGLLESRLEPSPKGPARVVYERTEAGTEKLVRWLGGMPVMSDQRIHFLAQIFFMDEAVSPEQSYAFISELRAAYVQKADAHAREEERLSASGESDFAVISVRYGSHHAKASIAWCDEALGLLEERTR